MAGTQKRRLPIFLYARALREARGWYPHMAVIFASSLVGIPLGLLAPVPFKIVLDHVLGSQPLPATAAEWLPAGMLNVDALLWAAIALGLLLAALSLAHNTGDWLLREWVAERMVRRFRGKLFLHALRLTPTDQQDGGSLDQVFRINNDSQALQWTAIYGLMPIVTAVATLIATLTVTWQISSALALVALATSVPLLLLIHFNQRRMCDRWHGVHELDSAVAARITEVLGAHRLVATSAQEGREQRHMLDLAGRAFSARLRVMVAQGLFGTGLALSTAVGTAAIMYLGVRDVMSGALTVGELTMVVAYIGQLYGPLQAIGTHMSSQQQAISAAERAFELIDRSPSVREAEDAVPLPAAAGDLRFENVHFAWPDGTRVLNGVGFHARPGTCVGIVGRSGSGKTTMLNLMMRLLDPVEGRILLDGQDLRRYKLADLRRQFAVVSQEPMLFSASVADNIAYVRPEATRAEIRAAAAAARADEFISNLPQGYDTIVGERGARLSGGERQRIAMARAFLAQAPILILDEPTSALDTGTEAEIIDSIEALKAGRTTFVVTHRLSALRGADMVLRLDGAGGVAEDMACRPEMLPAA